MQTVIIVIHLLIVLALVGVVLVQRSEGGGLGVGGGSGFMTARGAANALTRTTAILATAFFITSLALSLLARYYGNDPLDILDRLPNNAPGQTQSAPAGGGNGVLDQLGGSPSTPAAPAESAPVTPPSGDAPEASTRPAATSPAPDAPAVGAPAASEPAAPTTNNAAPQGGNSVPSGQ
ncbi:preprotein translocase subunit SecG [Tianweitania sp. BSSL-BM11]|uniref:Protein-export membrane protein SecG n=1 Tax=Tianweitania aestuarii TaxID=2814886 RepID=A0ABS5RTV7_9HYPH|nr:preprotein translocase subunit SecG [Tianweitania aestuarii]MBS9720431.1 preprotein translocase subunit SecG [Tianweitania aestuarii]